MDVDMDKTFKETIEKGDVKAVKDLPYVGGENPKGKKWYDRPGSFKQFQDSRIIDQRRKSAVKSVPKSSGGK